MTFLGFPGWGDVRESGRAEQREGLPILTPSPKRPKRTWELKIH